MRESMNNSTRAADVAWIVAAIGALNWGLIGLFNWNLVDAIFGGGAREETSFASRIVYAIVGIAGVISLAILPLMRVRAAPQRTVTT